MQIIQENDLSDLFQRISLGEKQAFDSFFQTSYPTLLRFALGYVNSQDVAEELVSNVFVKLWLKRADLTQVSNPKVYVYVAVKNAALDWLRRNAKHKHTSIDEVGEEHIIQGYKQNPESVLADKELQAILDRAVSELAPQRRLIFTMVKIDGLKCREVAAILGISVRTVEGQVYKAVKSLADSLSGHLGYNPQTYKKSDGKILLLNFF